jgi:nuclear transport factor 2 (NTF2) superfamily protein
MPSVDECRPQQFPRMVRPMYTLQRVAIFSLLPPFAASGQTGEASDRKAIQRVMDQFMDAWNRHDAKAFAAAFAVEAGFTNWGSTTASGRSKIEEFHAPMFATIHKSSHQ